MGINLYHKIKQRYSPTLIQIQVDGYFGYDFAVLDANSQGQV
jgi:hypothetical protein